MLRVLILSSVKFFLKYYFLSLFLCFSVSSVETFCRRQEDCNNNDRVRCGICVDDTSTPGEYKCIFPFPAFYKPDRSCSQLLTCQSNNCAGHGVCRQSGTHYRRIISTCYCDQGFYGYTCDHPVPVELEGVFFRYIEFPYKIVTAPAQDSAELIFFLCGSRKTGLGSVEIISEDEGYYLQASLSRYSCKTNLYVVKRLFKTRFPYRPPTNKYSKTILRLGDEVLGYLSSFKITIAFGGAVNYQQSFPVFVSYKEVSLKCVPVVEILGGSPSHATMIDEATITRALYVHIRSHVVFIADGRYLSQTKSQPDCADSAIYEWKVWRNVDNDTVETYVTLVNVKELMFPQFYLEVGYYRVLLEVTSVLEKPSKNYDYCYFNVMFEPLVAIIDGGSERVVQKHLGLLLTTTRSKDPNMPAQKQGHMKASWSCVDTSDHNKEICNPFKFFRISNSFFVPPEKLHFGSVLKITLMVWTDYYKNCKTCGTVQPGYAFATIIVAKEVAVSDDDIFIQCLLNCKEKVVSSEQLYLKVKTRSGSKFETYVWTYYEEGEEIKGTENITIQGLPNFMLLVKKSVFSAGKKYTIVVRNKKENLMAKYSFKTVNAQFGGNCTMDPMSGTRGLSTFNIVCLGFTNNGIASSFLFEFYDKTPEEAEAGLVFSGRMLGSSRDGELRNFRVTRGHVLVYIKDDSGLYTHRQFVISLLHWDVTEQVVDEIFKNITDSKEQQELAQMVEWISIIPDVVSTKLNKSRILERLLNFVTDFPTSTLPDVKYTSSTLTNVLVTLNKPDYLTMKLNSMCTVINLLQTQALLFSSTVEKGTELQGMSFDEIHQLTTFFLTNIYTIFKCKDPRAAGLNEFELDFETEDKLTQISNSAVEVLHSIQNVLTFLQSPGLPPINITSENNAYVVWVVTNDEDYDLTNYLAESNGFLVSVSKRFIQEFEKSTGIIQEHLVVRLATLDNIFWWRRSDVKSNLVSVSLVKQLQNNRLRKIRFVRNSLDVQINLNESLLNTTEISDITFQYQYSRKCSLDLDLAIKTHRLDPSPDSLITLRFLYPQTNGSLNVLIYRNHRPECDMMKEAVTISEQSPNYPSVFVQGDEPSFFYIGIVPGPSHTNNSVNYTFQVNTTTCQHWEREHWSNEGCKISAIKTTDVKVHCNCDHFSIFAGAFPVPPQEVDPFSDISLFLTVFDNPVVVVFVSVVLFIYLIACVWAFCKDRYDRKLRNVIILSDNFPGDRFPYLVAVYTSSRFNAGTTAHVGMKIIGSLATSRPHILTSSERKTLKRNYDDWFLIYYSEHLGELRNIHIWHDNAGSSPEWFCDKIVVYDLKDNSDAVFVVQQWLALRINCYPEANVSAATIGQVYSVKRLFLDNCVLGLREGHIFLSIVFRHPRSAMTRLQKISVLMCCIMVAMLCSIMFYSSNVDEGNYNVGMRDFYISIQSLVITFVTTFLVLLAFKKSYKFIYQRNRSTTLYKASKFQEYDVLKNIHQKKTFFAAYVRFVSKRLRGSPLMPVQFAKTKRDVKRRYIFLVLAWISCIAVIIICSFFVMLYGLKLGLVKSKMWLSSVLFTVAEELFILGPLKIIILSVVLSMAFQTMSETNTHQVYAADALKVKTPAELEQYEKLSSKRKHPMYAPLRHDAIEDMKRKKELRYKWQTVVDFVLSLCFIIVVSIVTQKLWSAHYNSNRHVYNIVTQPHHFRLGSVLFSTIRNVSQMEDYLRVSLIQTLYVNRWYNKNLIDKEGVERSYWLEDFTLRKVGVERLRQVRVTSVRCQFRFMNTTRRCIPRWDTSHEDTQDYSVRWGIAQWHDLLVNKSIWKYSKSSVDMMYTMYRLYGKSGTLYHDGGYLTYLGPSRLSAESTITNTIFNNWQDLLTRAVFVEFTLFNVNRNLFSQVTLIVEYLITGNIQLKAQVTSIESSITLSFWNVLLALFLTYYVVRSGELINRQGLMEFLASPANLTQVLVIAVGILSFVVATVHYFSSYGIYNDFIENGIGSFFDFDSFVFYFLILHSMLSLLFCLAILLSSLHLRGGKTLVSYFYTFTFAASPILGLTVVIIVFLLLQLHWLLLLYIYYFMNVQEVIIHHTFAVPDYYKDMCSGQFFLVKSLVVSLMLKFYFVIFTHSFRIARTRRVKNSDKFNFITFIFEQARRKKGQQVTVS